MKLWMILAVVAALLLTACGETEPEPALTEGADTTERAPIPEEEQSAAAVGETLEITSARWEGDVAIAEGVYTGPKQDFTCDLQEGADGGVTDWWDRAAAEPEFTGDNFRVVFQKATDREITDPLDPSITYYVDCLGVSENGLVQVPAVPVEGGPTPVS